MLLSIYSYYPTDEAFSSDHCINCTAVIGISGPWIGNQPLGRVFGK